MGFLPGAIVVTPLSRECYLLTGLGVTPLCSTVSTCFSHSCLVILLILALCCYTFCLARKRTYISNCASSIHLITHSTRTILPTQQPNSMVGNWLLSSHSHSPSLFLKGSTILLVFSLLFMLLLYVIKQHCTLQKRLFILLEQMIGSI